MATPEIKLSFNCDKNTPHFSVDELCEIYHRSEEKTTVALRNTARLLYPGRDPISYENLIIREGFARAYMHKGDYRKPKWTILAYPLMLGIMDDGTIYDR